MTDIRITANGKPSYHFYTDKTLTKKEVEREVKSNIFPKKGVKFETTINIDGHVQNQIIEG